MKKQLEADNREMQAQIKVLERSLTEMKASNSKFKINLISNEVNLSTSNEVNFEASKSTPIDAIELMALLFS